MAGGYAGFVTDKMGIPSGVFFLIVSFVCSAFALIGYLGVYFTTYELETSYDKLTGDLDSLQELSSGFGDFFSNIGSSSSSSTSTSSTSTNTAESQQSMQAAINAVTDSKDLENAVKVLSRVHLSSVWLQASSMFATIMYILLYKSIAQGEKTKKMGIEVWYLSLLVIAPSIINLFFSTLGFLLAWGLDVLAIVLGISEDVVNLSNAAEKPPKDPVDFDVYKEKLVGDVLNVGELPKYKGFDQFLPARYDWVIFAVCMGIASISFAVSFLIFLIHEDKTVGITLIAASASHDVQADKGDSEKEEGAKVKRKAAGSMYF